MVFIYRRRESFLLRAGHKCAHMYTESAEYQYMKLLTTPKAWFKANIDATLKIYGRDHNIQKEDLLLGTHTLSQTGSVLCVKALLLSQSDWCTASSKLCSIREPQTSRWSCKFANNPRFLRLFSLLVLGSFQCLFGSKKRTSVGNVYN